MSRSCQRYRRTNSHADSDYAASWNRSSTPWLYLAEDQPMARLSWQENWLTNTPFPDNFDPLSPIPRRFNTRRLKSVAIAVTQTTIYSSRKDCENTSTQQAAAHSRETAEFGTKVPAAGLTFTPSPIAFLFLLLLLWACHNNQIKCVPNLSRFWTSAQESVYFHQVPHHVYSYTGAALATIRNGTCTVVTRNSSSWTWNKPRASIFSQPELQFWLWAYKK